MVPGPIHVLGSPLVRIRETAHRLKERNMGKHAEDIFFALLDSVDEENLSREKSK